MLAGKGQRVVAPLLAEVDRYTFEHFAHEEELMAAVRYPEMRHQVQEHDELRRKTSEFQKRYEAGETTLTIELTVFLSEWLKNHIMRTDRQLGDYIRATGRTPAARGGKSRV
jgi:hemerythrin-like metal-binding protein